MPEQFKTIEEKGLKDVKVFQICEDDSVAAYSLEEAKDWYKKITGLTDEDLYPNDEIHEVNMDYEVWADEKGKEKIKVREIVKHGWDNEPFIVTSSYL